MNPSPGDFPTRGAICPARHVEPGLPVAFGQRDGLDFELRTGRTTAIAVLDATAVVSFFVGAGWLALRLATAPYGSADLMLLPLAIVAGYLLADFTSGLVHWVCDSYFDERTRLVGRVIISPFRQHHRDPRAMTKHGFLETNGNSCLVLLLLLVPMVLFGEPSVQGQAVPWLALQWLALSFSLTTFVTNQLHKWAHLPEPRPAWLRLLQSTGLVLTPTRHALHHRPPHGDAFCVTAGWMNPFVDRIAKRVRASRPG